ncbi:MAG: nucleotidyltransferase substrate binding protein [Deltaproteobacteria bacterium]|nr:nucleotidyltransferase substrate binding protein [Deltaproteobacteria bacterium]
MADKSRLAEASLALAHALAFAKKAKSDPFYAAGIAKSFEICFEYAWKYLKAVATEHGLEAHSPRDAIKTAARMGLLDDAEAWLGFLEDRNLSVHDYLGVDDAGYLQTVKSFRTSVEALLRREP